MLQNVQSVTTFPLPPSKIPDFIETTEDAERRGNNGKHTETLIIYNLTIYDLQFIYDGTYLRFHRFVAVSLDVKF